MRCKVVFFMLGILVIAGGCITQPEDLLVDDFEGKINSSTVDYGAGEGSEVTVVPEADIVRCGKQSLKISYNLKPSGYMWIARGFGLDVPGAAAWVVQPETIAWRRYNALSIFMYGSGSGSVVAFDVRDSGGEYWRFLLTDDFTGWKEIICPFAHFFVRSDWQPEDAEVNEVIDFPIRSFQFEPRLPGQGTYYFDCVKVVKRALK